MNYLKEKWGDYRIRLESYGYTIPQLIEVQKIRENPEIEEITKDQYDFLVQTGIISRTRKLKKIRTLYVFEDKVWYLCHFNKKYEWCAKFVNEEE